MGVFNIWNTSGANKASLTFTGSSDKTVDTNTVLQSTDSTASIANGKVVVDSSGNVGIGVTPSAWSGKVAQVGNSALLSIGTGTYLKTNSYFDGSTARYISDGYATTFDSPANGTFVWYTAPSGTAGSVVPYTQTMKLDASGVLSVGTMYVGVSSNGSYNENLRLYESSNQYSSIILGATNGTTNGTEDGQWSLIRFPDAYSNKFSIRHNSTDLIEITKSGVLTLRNGDNISVASNIWTAGNQSGMTAANYTWVNALNVDLAKTSIDRGWNNEPSITVRNDTSNGSQASFRIHGINGISGGDFSVVTVSDGGYSSSDRRRKTDIVNIDNALSKVLQLQGRQFKYVNSNLEPQTHMSEDDGNKFGFIAQEIENIIPQVVKKFEGDVSVSLANGYADGYAVDYSSVVALLVEAIKEQESRIKILETEVLLSKGAVNGN